MQEFDVQTADQRDICVMMKEFRERWVVVVCWGVSCAVEHLGDEKQ